jgi:ASC-1-like (ASCH) protein
LAIKARNARPQKSQKIRELDIFDDFKVYISEIQIQSDSTSFEEAIRGIHSKWQEAKEDEMKSIIPTMFGT